MNNYSIFSVHEGVLCSVKRTKWENSKYDVDILASIEAVQGCEFYLDAKSGDLDKSIRLAKRFYNIAKLGEIKKQYSQPVILPITAEEKQGKNAIPLGMASVIKNATGWHVTDSVFQTNKAGHTKANGWYRIVSHATFAGKIEKGAEYLIIDDFVGMGGTLAAVKALVETGGGIIAGYHVLTGKHESAKLYLREKTLQLLREKHGSIEGFFKKQVGFDFSKLTESEARYLLRAKTIERIRNQITKALSQRIGIKN